MSASAADPSPQTFIPANRFMFPLKPLLWKLLLASMAGWMMLELC